MSEPNIPTSARHIRSVIQAFLVDCFDDPVVGIKELDPRTIQVRVGQGDRGPQYYTIKVITNV